MPDRGVLGTRGLVVGWEGQLGALAPKDVTAVAAPGLSRHLSSTSKIHFLLFSPVKLSVISLFT